VFGTTALGPPKRRTSAAKSGRIETVNGLEST
jgi:hypothetical protein